MNTDEALLDIVGGNPEDPEVTLRVVPSFIEVELDTFHFLRKRVEYDERLDAIWQKWDKKWRTHGELTQKEHREKYGYARPDWCTEDSDRMRRFPEWLYERCPGIYKFGAYGDESPVWVHTYNVDNMLSGDIVIVAWEADHEGYALIAGADPYGVGRARLFTTQNYFDDLFDYNHADIVCPEGHQWTFDGCSTWARTDDEEEGENLKPEDIKLNDKEEPLCPVCGGVLKAWGIG